MDRPFLIGKKVYFRPLEPEDVNDEYLQWVNDQDVVLGRIEVHFPVTKEKQIEYVRSQLARNDIAFFAIMEKGTDKFIGTAKIGPINWIHRFTEHAIMIGDKGSWNKGYGGEVIQLLLEYGFRHLNMHKIYAGIISTNQSSIKKNERIGYKIEAVLKEKIYVNGKYADHIIMSMSKNEFLKLYPQSILEKGSKKIEKGNAVYAAD